MKPKFGKYEIGLLNRHETKNETGCKQQSLHVYEKVSIDRFHCQVTKK